jgi:protein-tyrosine phosphatase
LNFIDIHCHILPGMDDGPALMDESLKMIGIAERDGISGIFATPHIIDGLFPNNGRKILSSVDDLRSRIQGGVEIYHGADVRITPDLVNRLESGDVPTLGGSGYMLMEFPEFIVPPNVEGLVFRLRNCGVTPVITHPERHLRLMHDLDALAELRSRGMMCQITAMSLTGDFGAEIRRASFAMIDRGLVDFVASDAHNADRRPPVLSGAHKEVKKHFGDKAADMIFFGNPGRILETAGRRRL